MRRRRLLQVDGSNLIAYPPLEAGKSAADVSPEEMVMHAPEESRHFPSGRTVADCRKDAKRLARNIGISLAEALNQIAIKNGAP